MTVTAETAVNSAVLTSMTRQKPVPIRVAIPDFSGELSNPSTMVPFRGVGGLSTNARMFVQDDQEVTRAGVSACAVPEI